MTNQSDDTQRHGLKEKLSGLGQKIIGEIEEIGGALTGDPMTVAEGELNVEIGEMREEIEGSLDNSSDDISRQSEVHKD